MPRVEDFNIVFLGTSARSGSRRAAWWAAVVMGLYGLTATMVGVLALFWPARVKGAANGEVARLTSEEAAEQLRHVQ